MTQPTSKKLADALAAEPCAPEHEARRQVIVKGALHDHYHDFFGHTATPTTDLYNDCLAIGLTEFAARALDGEFEASAEEMKAWEASDDGRETLAKVKGTGGCGGEAPTHTLGDGPIEAEQRAVMNMLGTIIDGLLNANVEPKKNGFILMAFPFAGHEGRCNYISNGNRADIVVLLKEQIRRFEGQPEVTGHG